MFSIFKKLIFLPALLISCHLAGQNTGMIKTGKCISYEVLKNKAFFVCDNQLKIKLEIFNQDIIKFNYQLPPYAPENESFAVVYQADSLQTINLSEQPDSYEIYTSELIIRINKNPFQIRVYDKWQKLIMEDYRDLGFTKDSVLMTSNKTLKKGERIYGLGEKNGTINRIGQTFTMWNSDKPCYSTSEDPLYKSIPFFISSEGYGIFFDNTGKTEFDFGATNPAKYSFSAPTGDFTYYFIFGPQMKTIIEQYTKLTGKPIMPPAWAFGFAQCRGLLTNEKLTREIATTYRQKQIPCDIIYQDIGWTRYLQDFEWRPENYSDPEKMVSDLRNEGFKIIVSQDPVISQENKLQWHEADSLGFFTTDRRTGKTYNMPWPWGGNCGVVDFTKPEVADWWGNYQQKVIDDGVSGFWTDMGEPAWSNEESTDRLFMQHYAGNHAQIHNVYGLTWDKVVTTQFEKHNPNRRIFQMTRAGFAGLQRYTFGWSGDSGNGNNVTQGWNQLAAQIPLAISSGLGLIPFWSCDISGYCGDIKDYQAMSELYIRWLQFGAFNPLSRIHHEGNNAVEPWLFGPETEKICKTAIELKYQLFPYIYTCAREAYDKGLPLIRPMVMEFPDDKNTYHLDDQFMFGPGLLVAPIVEEGSASRRIYLPKGNWLNFSDKTTVYTGEQWIDLPISISTIPVMVRQGAVIPQMPVMQFIGQNPDYPLLVDIFPLGLNKETQFAIYEDDGETNDYKKDLYRLRKISCITNTDGYAIACSMNVSNNYLPKNRMIIYRLYTDNKPVNVIFEDKKLKQIKPIDEKQIEENNDSNAFWFWDQQHKACIIKVPASVQYHQITIKK